MNPTRPPGQAEPETPGDERDESAGAPPSLDADPRRWRRLLQQAATAARTGNQECVPF